MKANNFCAVLLTCISIFLVGCGEEKVHNVQYYIDNPNEIKKVQERCRSEYKKGYELDENLSKSCENARKASSIIIKDKISLKSRKTNEKIRKEMQSSTVNDQ